MPDTQSNFRMLHTMIRVKDLDKSLKFYTEELGMNLIRMREYPTAAFRDVTLRRGATSGPG